mmetsp:Transcript_25767/g.50446  ORF Transcript_25767/g.50446 Transcript_25767/m.50446 type:complete len:86 (+) Transcript_25767:853-1110(+)
MPESSLQRQTEKYSSVCLHHFLSLLCTLFITSTNTDNKLNRISGGTCERTQAPSKMDGGKQSKTKKRKRERERERERAGTFLINE